RRHTRFSRDWSSDVCSSDLRIRRFENQQAARHQYTPGLGDQRLKNFEGKVLDHMERTDQRQTRVGLRPQPFDPVGTLRRQATLEAGGEHALVEIDAPALEALRDQQFEPLAATATDVDATTARKGRLQPLDEWQVDPQPGGDQLARSAITVFEGTIETDVGH